jgi:nicotinate-nucleotide pyrophosphorylase (carboxylating)
MLLPTAMNTIDSSEVEDLIETALKEDMPQGDITSESIIPASSLSRAVFLAKEAGRLAGLDVARRVYEKIDQAVVFKKRFEDGADFKKGDILAEVRGHSIALLKGERTSLNFLQRLSGIATTTRKYVLAVKGTKTKILDTRKTTPGLRALEKYAVRMGGGQNHRLNLSEMVLIKDNHLRLAGSVSQAVHKARAGVRPGVKIEVEVTDFGGAREALEAGADMIMLDNMTLPAVKHIVSFLGGRVPVEVSGGVTVERAGRIAALGVDFISVGGLTHSYHSVDISLEFQE